MMGAAASKNVSVELKLAIKNFNAKLEQVLKKHHDALEDFIKYYQKWLQKRTAVIEALLSLQDAIDKHHRNVNIASISGSSVSLVSGAACLAGLALAPFTGGLSVGLCAAGLLGTSAGSLTTVGAQIVGFGLSKKALKHAFDLIKEDCQETMHLSSLIEHCVKQQTEIQDLVMNNDFLSVIRQNESLLTELLTNPLLKERYQRIKKGTASADDVLIIVSLLYSGDLICLKKIHSANRAIFIEPKLMEGTVKAAATMRTSVVNIRKCAVLFKNWRLGIRSLGMASKASRLAKGAALGLSMAVDAYDVGSTAKEMICKEKSNASTSLQSLIGELKKQTEDISSYYHSLTV